MEWVEIPNHRVLVVHLIDRHRFTFVTEDGSPAPEGSSWGMIHRVIRDDGRVFRVARFWPHAKLTAGCYALEEI